MAAIYMWLEDEQIVLTTTLYPVEAIDGMQLGASFAGATMGVVPASHATLSYGSADGVFQQERWFVSDGPYDSHATLTYGSADGIFQQERWFYEDGPYDSHATLSYGSANGELLLKLVTADTPDEELQLGITLDPTCTMELI